jgi:hypothetical protein
MGRKRDWGLGTWKSDALFPPSSPLLVPSLSARASLTSTRYAAEEQLLSPFPVDELLQKLTELQSAINTGKDSL